jgi:hypothetical protein
VISALGLAAEPGGLWGGTIAGIMKVIYAILTAVGWLWLVVVMVWLWLRLRRERRARRSGGFEVITQGARPSDEHDAAAGCEE